MTKDRGFLCIAAALFLLTVTWCGAPPSDASPSEYRSPDGNYAYLTFGSGTQSSPYESTIVGLTGASDGVVLPEALEGYPLTSISAGAFSGCHDMTFVVIPGTVTSVATGAFNGCDSLTMIYFLGDRPDMDGAVPQGTDVKRLPDAEGWGATATVLPLRTHYGDGFSFDYYVIDGTATVHRLLSGTDVTIPSEVSDADGTHPVGSVGASAFAGTDVESVRIQEGVGETGVRSFYYCESLAVVELPASLRIVNDESFRHCISLGNVDLRDAEFIGFEAFRMCYSFTSVDVPDTVSFLGDGCFYYCQKVTSISLGANVSGIPSRAFTACGAEALSVPETVSSVGYYSFADSTALGSVSLPHVTDIGGYAFSGCDNLEDVDFGDSLERIGEYAFGYCTLLGSVSLPPSLVSVGEDAFHGCKALSSVTFEGASPSVGEDAFKGTSGDLSIIALGDGGMQAATWALLAVSAGAVAVSAALFILHRRNADSGSYE